MNKTEILRKALQKAADNGWVIKYRGSVSWSVGELAEYLTEWSEGLESVIFDHDFAKALWGDCPYGEVTTSEDDGPEVKVSDIYAWQYHLQQMVIAKDPIQYLGDHLND